MPKMWVLPFADTGTDFDDTDGWIEIDVESESAAYEWCCNHCGLIEHAEYGVDRVPIIRDGYIDFYFLA